MANRVFVVGVGMTKFCKPQKGDDSGAPTSRDFARVAIQRALDDACINFNDVEAAVVGSISGPQGQQSLYQMGMKGIPIFNVSNACATGSNAVYLSRNFVASGMHDCTLALGIEIMKPGPLGGTIDVNKKSKQPAEKKPPMYPDAPKVGSTTSAMKTKYPLVGVGITPQMFGNAGRDHMALYGSTPDHFAKIGEKNHRHSANNPYSQFRETYTLEEIKSSPMIYEPLTKLQCSPTSDGAAAAIIASEAFVKKHGLEGQAIEIIGQSMKTDVEGAFDGNKPRTCIEAVGYGMAQAAAQDVFRQTGLTAHDAQVIELHDCFSCNEILTYEALGLAPEGQGHTLVDSGDNTFGGKWVVNPSGGLISKGHPIGATGVAQCAELNWQLRGEAGPRQVQSKIALQHNLGLGGCVVVTMYKKPEDWEGIAPKRKVSGAMGFPEMTSKL